MYGAALALTAGTTAGTTGLPFFQLGSLNIGIPIQAFGVIVAAGVLIGAALLRRYAEWHGVEDEHIRGLLGWVTVSGFLGAHILDVLFYEPQKLDEPIASWPPTSWPALIRIWDGISSYGGFVGGAIGFALYVWWKRLPVRLMADITIVGLLPAFSIGRIGCTVVSDHIGAAVDPDKWYAGLAMNYPADLPMKPVQDLVKQAARAGHPYAADGVVTAWNLGLIEFMYLVPVNALILWLAFRSRKRMPAGFIVALTGVLYAPVRFFLDFLRPTSSDPHHLGLTFAQWASVAAFGAACYAASLVLKNGTIAETVAPTSGEAQARLRSLLKEDEERAEREKEEKEAEERAERARKRAEELEDDDADESEAEEPEADESESEADEKAEAKAGEKPKAKTDEKPSKADKKDEDEDEKAASDDDDKSDKDKPKKKR